jgi:hypothetical protein
MFPQRFALSRPRKVSFSPVAPHGKSFPPRLTGQATTTTLVFSGPAATAILRPHIPFHRSVHLRRGENENISGMHNDSGSRKSFHALHAFVALSADGKTALLNGDGNIMHGV